jgi:uncharacterized protein
LTVLLDGLLGELIEPQRPNGLGVVVLGGSSGRIDVPRARLFADRGALALALQWFGGEGQPASVRGIALESFAPAIELLLARGCRRIAYMGTSRGAEAALLLAAHDARIDAVIAFSPSSLVWGEFDWDAAAQAWRQYTSFTLAGRPLPFVRYDEATLGRMDWTPPIAYLTLFQRSLDAADPAALEAAAIPIERSSAAFVLVAGGDDALWPAGRFAHEVADRLASHGKRARVVVHEDAGHRVLLPGETTPRSTLNRHGGTDAADRALGAEAWPVIAETLGLDP